MFASHAPESMRVAGGVILTIFDGRRPLKIGLG
jgi:hypothetical protein